MINEICNIYYILKLWNSLDNLWDVHCDKCQKSKVFRIAFNRAEKMKDIGNPTPFDDPNNEMNYIICH